MTTFDRAIEALEKRAWQDGLEVSNGAPLVRAVLLAIREPDEERSYRIMDTFSFCEDFREDGAAWTEEIDAILKERP